jgi:hypothetical protein
MYVYSACRAGGVVASSHCKGLLACAASAGSQRSLEVLGICELCMWKAGMWW